MDEKKGSLIYEYLKLRQKVGELESFRAETIEEKELYRKFRILFYEINDLAYILDNKENILYINDAFKRLTGHEAKSFLGKSLVPLFDDANLKKARNAHSRILKGEEEVKYELCFKNTGIVCEYKSFPMRGDDGRVIGVMGIGRDITERMRAEEELKDIKRRLEEMVRERTLELMKTNKTLKKVCVEHDDMTRRLGESEKRYRNLKKLALRYI